jgi:hypothetical protein
MLFMNQNALQVLLLANFTFSVLTDVIRRGTDLHMAMAVVGGNLTAHPHQTAEPVIYLTPRQPNDRGLSPPSPVVSDRVTGAADLPTQLPTVSRGPWCQISATLSDVS